MMYSILDSERTAKYYFITILYLVLAVFGGCQEQTLSLGSGCSQLGCNPSGGFSFSGNLPLSNVTLRWQNDQGLAAIPDFGCVGTSTRIVCPLRTANSTLVGIDSQTGKLIWRDDLLHYPSMPLIDFYSDVIACDGSLLVPYNSQGDLLGKPISFSPSMNPVFSLTLTDNDAFIISGYEGKLVTYLTNGVIHASIFLNASIEGINGIFVPIIEPVVSGHRAYILTQFKPDTRERQSVVDDEPIIRLYAVDILRQAVGRMNIIWFHTFKNNQVNVFQKKSKINVKKKYVQERETQFPNKMHANVNSNKNRQHSNESKNCIVTKGTMIFLTLNVQYNNNVQLFNNIEHFDESGNSILYGFNDTGLGYEILFQVKESIIALSSTVDHSAAENSSQRSFAIWAATRTTVYKIGANSEILHKINLKRVFGESVMLMSKLMVVTSSSAINTNPKNGDFILVAVACLADSCQPPRTQKHYVILINIQTEQLLWTVATPGDRAVLGQIISVPRFNKYKNHETEVTDLIVASASGMIFALGGN